ncbi:MAG: hypothetical protein FWE42_04295 [Defluviitaleaceae bacterium]|nr:hypothetical protein [Defluviitaleaceae bacterium]
MKTKNKNQFFIEPEIVIVNLLQADKKRYSTFSRLLQFVLFIQEDLVNYGNAMWDKDVEYRISFDSVKRTVEYNNKEYDIVGNRIIWKGEDSTHDNENEVAEIIRLLAQAFVEKYAA